MKPPNDIPNALRWGIYTIQQVGFPIGVAIYLLYRMDALLRGLTDAFLEQASVFEALIRTIQ